MSELLSGMFIGVFVGIGAGLLAGLIVLIIALLQPPRRCPDCGVVQVSPAREHPTGPVGRLHMSGMWL